MSNDKMYRLSAEDQISIQGLTTWFSRIYGLKEQGVKYITDGVMVVPAVLFDTDDGIADVISQLFKELGSKWQNQCEGEFDFFVSCPWFDGSVAQLIKDTRLGIGARNALVCTKTGTRNGVFFIDSKERPVLIARHYADWVEAYGLILVEGETPLSPVGLWHRQSDSFVGLLMPIQPRSIQEICEWFEKMISVFKNYTCP